MTIEERADEAIRLLSHRTEVLPSNVIEWLRGEIETQIRGAMKDQQRACAESLTACEGFAPGFNNAISRDGAHQAVMNAEVKTGGE